MSKSVLIKVCKNTIRNNTLISAEPLLPDEALKKDQFLNFSNGSDGEVGQLVPICSSLSSSICSSKYSNASSSTQSSGKVADTLKSLDEIIHYSNDFSDLTISKSSAISDDGTLYGVDGIMLCRRLDETVGDEYSSDFENFSHNQEPSPSSVNEQSLSANQDEITEGAVQGFVARKVEVIKSRKLLQNTCRPAVPTDYQCRAMNDFIKMKVTVLQQELDRKAREDLQEPDREISEERILPTMLVNTKNIECLRIDNLLCRMKKASSAKFHMPNKCYKCKQTNGLMAEKTFMRRKLDQLRKHEIEKNLDKHFLQNATTLVADIINSGPKPSDPPEDIWHRLLKNVKQ